MNSTPVRVPSTVSTASSNGANDVVSFGFVSNRDLGNHEPGSGIQGGQQRNLTAVTQAGAPQSRAVDRDHPAIPARGQARPDGPEVQPAGENAAQHGRIQPDRQPPHRRAGRHAVTEPEPDTGGFVEVVQPIGDRCEQGRAGHDRQTATARTADNG
jgi:hypothetical protein